MSAGILIKASVSNDKSSKKTETKIQRDLKELIDRHISIFGSSRTSERNENKNPLENFFIDEINLTKKTLNVIRVDVENLRLEDTKVQTNFLKFQINLTKLTTNIYQSLSNYILYYFAIISIFILRLEGSKDSYNYEHLFD